MFIRLGDTSVNYPNEERNDDFMIVAQVVSSRFSYEKPILVRSEQELDIWFSQDFPDRYMLIQLLNKGVTLYLYRPISNSIIKDDFYIDYSNFTELVFQNRIVSKSDIDSLNELRAQTNRYKFSVVDQDSKDSLKFFTWTDNDFCQVSNSSTLDELSFDVNLVISDLEVLKTFMKSDNFKINVYDDFTEDSNFSSYILVSDQLINVRELPQNLNFVSTSLNNRDTLLVTYSDKDNRISFAYPSYDELIKNFSFPEDVKEVNLEHYDDTRSFEGKQTFALKIVNKDKKSNEKYVGYFVAIDPKTNKRHIIHNGETPEDCYDVVGKVLPEPLTTEEFISEVESYLEKLGYTILHNEDYDVAITDHPITSTYYYKFKKLYVGPDFNESQNIISPIANKFASIGFWSKTIGYSGEDDRIKVTIEELESEGFYRVKISRYNYEEVYEGSIDPVKYKSSSSRLDNIISYRSKLVYCKLFDTDHSLRTGTYYLRRGKIEAITRKSWITAVNAMFNSDIDNVYVDYFLIPDMYKYGTVMRSSVDKEGEFNWFYREYLYLLGIARRVGCQFLIQNNNSPYRYIKKFKLPEIQETGRIYFIIEEEKQEDGFVSESVKKIYLNGKPCRNNKILLWTITGNDYIFNYLGDIENRLVYFYKSITLPDVNKTVPGYYLYLLGLLDGNFSASSDKIIYPIISKNPYKDPTKTSMLETRLSVHKSNYLSYNNLTYFYKNIQNGIIYDTTGWMRFAMGKISREIHKNKWEFLGTKTYNVREKIENLLNEIKDHFSIFNSIKIVEYSESLVTNTLYLVLEVWVHGLMDDIMTLNFTLNYNKEN